MGRKHRVAPIEEQDQLEDGLLKTNDNCYVKLNTAKFCIDGEWDNYGASITQDKLKKGLIKMPNDTYIPLSKIEEIEEGDCFIATAVYGNGNAPQVRILRDFRDNVLMQNSTGRIFVNFYYGGTGKKTADFIREHLPSTIPTVRRGLDVLVERYSAHKSKIKKI